MKNLILLLLTIFLISLSFALNNKISLFYDKEYTYSQQLSKYQWNSNKSVSLMAEAVHKKSDYFGEHNKNMN